MSRSGSVRIANHSRIIQTHCIFYYDIRNTSSFHFLHQLEYQTKNNYKSKTKKSYTAWRMYSEVSRAFLNCYAFGTQLFIHNPGSAQYLKGVLRYWIPSLYEHSTLNSDCPEVWSIYLASKLSFCYVVRSNEIYVVNHFKHTLEA